MPGKTILCWGRFDRHYSRNRILRQLLTEAGWTVQEFLPRVSELGGLEAMLRGVARPDALWVPAFRQRDFPAARRFASRHRIPLLFDPLISAWDKAVHERQKFSEESFRAGRLLRAERQLFSRADLLLADTAPHARFFVEKLHAPAASTFVVPVGAEEGIFTCQPPAGSATRAGGRPEILFYGSFIGLQGSRTIAAAARLVPEASWVLLGDGPERQACTELAAGHPQIRFEPPIPYRDLPGRIARADLLLGVFGPSAKAARVIPNKVYQALACGRPVLTRESPAYPEELVQDPESGIAFVPAADPEALATAARELIADPNRLARAAGWARGSYEKWFSTEQLRRALAVVLARLDCLVVADHA